jgi:Lon protease-like protein
VLPDLDGFHCPTVVPVFPLPNTVLFPYTVLPLHIFEPRYRVMVEDARENDGIIAITLADGSEFHSIGTLGRMRDIETLPDGRFLIRLDGLLRAELTEAPSDRPYRLAHVEPRPEPDVEEQDPEVERAKLALLATLGYLRSELSEHGGQPIVLDERLPLPVAVNIVCAGLPVDADERQALLEESDLVERQRRASTRMQSVLETVLRHKSRRAELGAGKLLH